MPLFRLEFSSLFPLTLSQNSRNHLHAPFMRFSRTQISLQPLHVKSKPSKPDFTQVKCRHFSSSIRGFSQYQSCMRSFSEKNFENSPISLSYGLSDSKNKIRKGMIVASNDDKNASDESSSSESVITEKNTTSNDQFLSSDQPQIKGIEMPKPMLKRAREKLRAARILSKYTESKPIKPAMGSKILDALRETDKGKNRSGLPEAPTNLFDDSNRGLGKEGWSFQLPGGNDLFVVAFSFVFITTVMFATTYLVWKVGAIHFNEY